MMDREQFTLRGAGSRAYAIPGRENHAPQWA